MSYSSRQVNQSRSSRMMHNQPITQHQIISRQPIDYQDLVYKSYQYPQQIGFQDLVTRKNVLTQLLHEFESGSGDRVIFDRQQSGQYQKRLHLLQQQIDNLLRYQMVMGDGTDSGRTINYTNFINQKENQINELERKITYYQTTFRKHENRVRELENEVARLHSIIVEKNKMIDHLKGNSVREWQNVKDSSINFLEGLMGDLEKIKRNGGNLSFGLLEGTIQAWIGRLPEQSNLRLKIKNSEERGTNITKYRDFLMGKLSQINSLYKSQIQDLSTRLGSSARIEYDDRILSALSLSDIKNNAVLENVFGGIFEMAVTSGGEGWGFSRVVEVPVQDARTKALIHKLAKQMQKIYRKYPQLSADIDPRLAEFFSQEIIDMIEVDEVDRLVEIVKIEPQVVRVDNVYAYSSEKSRKVEFHLRVLIKALLEEMQKMKAKTGVAPEIDEGVIGMIRNQIMDIVDVDDILRVYRTVPKIVEVEKIVEKVVQKIVEVPKYITAETREEYPVQVKRYDVVQNTRNIPFQQPVIQNLIQEKLVQVPQIITNIKEVHQIHENVVEAVVERPRVVEVEKVVPLNKEIPKVISVEGPEKIVEIPRPEVVELVKEVIVETQQRVQVIKQVQKVVEKIVEVVKEVPKIVEVQRIVTKTVPVKEYIQSERIVNHVTQRYDPVEIIVQKIVPISRVEERIVQVPQIIQKIVPVVEIRTQVVEVERLMQVPIYQKQLQIVEKIKEIPVVEIREVQKIVQKIVEVPIIHEVIKVVTQYVKEPVIQTIEKVIHKDVNIQKPVVMYEDRLVQVQTVINHCIEVPQIINIERQTLVPYEKVVDRIVPTPTIIEKIVEKIVEVPKVVEVEKIVQKIVPVPRIVEKVVEVEKIVQKIVQQTIFEEKIVEKECRVEVPVFHERLIQVEKPVNIYQRVEVPKPVVEQVFVTNLETRTVPEIVNIQQPPKYIIQTREVEVPMVIEKICTLRTIDNKYVELKEFQIVPVEIQLPVDLIKQKIVPIENVVPQIQVETAIMEKIVQVEVQPDPQVIQVDRVMQKLRVEREYEVVEDKIPYYQERIIQVPVEIQKIIEPVYYEVEKIVKVPHYIDKIVEKVIKIPQIYEVQRRNDVAVKDPIIIPIEKIVPQLITLNQSIETIVDRIVEVPRLLQKLNTVTEIHEKIVPLDNVQTRIEQIRLIQQKEVIVERIKQVENKIHLVSEVLQRVDKIIERPSEPVLICQQTIMEVPYIVQKIVEKIVVMPQIVEVLKYVHEIMENDNLLATSSTTVQDAQYTRLARSVNVELSKLRGMLGDLRIDGSDMRNQVAIIQGFLAQFAKLIAYPRIREVISEVKVDKIVEKERLVKIPVNTSDDSQRNLASAVLIDKLVNELRRFKLANPKMDWQLDQDILRIFGAQLQPVSRYHGNDYNKILDEYVRAIHSRFSSLGPWTTDHQEMLRSFIEDRFELAYNFKKNQQELVRSKAKYDSMKQSLSKIREQNDMLKGGFNQFTGIFSTIIEEGKRQNRIDQRTQNSFKTVYQSLSYLIKGFTNQGLHTDKLQPLEGERFTSLIRQKEEEIIKLKDRIRELMMGKSKCNLNHDHKWATSGSVDHTECNRNIRRLEQRVRELEVEVQRLYIIETDHRGCQSLIDSLRRQINSLRVEISNIRNKDDKGTKPSTTPRDKNQKDSSEGSLYGVNFMEYANLDENGSNSDTGRIQRGVYRSGNYDGGQKTYGYGAQNYSSQYMSPTGGLSSHGGGVQQLGTSSKKQSSFRSGYQMEYSGGQSGHGMQGGMQGGEQTFKSTEYLRSSNPSQGFIQMREARYESSEGGGSNLYGSTSSRQVIKKTTTRYQEGGSSMSNSRTGYDRGYQRRNQ